jgi:thiamine pyrophosphate-dependent acetolactate synthase large subunit-like protein
MHLAQAVGEAVAGLGTKAAFAVVGSGNFNLTEAMRRAGMRFVAARHETSAVSMAVGRAFGAYGSTIRSLDDLAAIEVWLGGPRDRPLVVDAKVDPGVLGARLLEAFRA